MPRGRPAKVIRPIEKTINIPEDILARVDLMLYSELEQRVPHGAWSRLITSLLQDWLKGIGGQNGKAE
jgi:hypothetical protein